MRTKLPRGRALLRAAYNYIAKHPDEWNQKNPGLHGESCGCLGVHACRIGGFGAGNASVALRSCSEKHFNYLFFGKRTMRELRARVVKILGTSRGVLPVPKGYRK